MKNIKFDNEILKKYFAPKYKEIIMLSILILSGTAISGITPFLYGKIIDLIINKNLYIFVKYLLIIIFISIVEEILATLEVYCGSKVTLKITNEMKKDVLSKITYMYMCKIDKYSKGKLINRLEGDAHEVVNTYISFITGIIQIGINAIISIYFTLRISLPLTICAIVFLLITYFGTTLFKKKYQATKSALKNFSDTYLGEVNDTFQNLEGIKSYTFETKIIEKFKKLYKNEFNLSKKMYKVECWIKFTKGFLNTFFDCGLLCIAAMLIIRGNLTIGSFVAFNQYVTKLFQSASQVIEYIMNLISCEVNLKRIKEILDDTGEEDMIIADNVMYINKINKIYIKNLNFRYNESLILDNINLEIKSVGFYSLVGMNGAGKSTLLKVLLKFYNWEKGDIYINDLNLKDIPILQIRQEISYISKEPFLFNESIEYNLTLGKHVDKNQLNDICNKVNLNVFVSELSNGYSTNIGDKGVFLSSGTKQKIAIARAMIKNASLWLCDEITSDLDGKVENDVLKILKKASKNKIVILVSHKLSSIVCSDIIFVLNDKKIIAKGTNQELLRTNKLYKQLFESNNI